MQPTIYINFIVVVWIILDYKFENVCLLNRWLASRKGVSALLS